MREFNRLILRAMRRRTLAVAIVGVALAAPAMYATLGSSAPSRAVRPAQKGAASIKTDRASYLAGDKIKISGAGFTPFESVMLQVKHANGTMENGMGHDAVWVYPDADGAFETTWTINVSDSAGTSFVVTANGSSGDIAQTGFTRTATVAVNPFNSSRGKTEIVAGGFHPNELITVRAGAASQTVRTDENGRASVVAEITNSGEAMSVSAASLTSELTALTVSTTDFNSNGWFSIVDSTYAQNGAACAVTLANPNGYCQDDVPLQNDLTRMGRNDADLNKYKVFMSWNSVTSWTGTGQTGNACALFSNRADGNIQFAVCAAVENTPGNPTVLRQVAGSPYAFTCGANKNDRCAQPTAKSFTATQVVAGQFGTLLSTGDLVTPTDPFPTAVGDLDHQDKDTTIEIDIDKSYLQSFLPVGAPAMDLVNVCSYPSAGSGGNNNPFDCIVRPSSGFLQITKTTTNATSTFTFDVKKGNNAAVPSSASISPTLVANSTTSYSGSKGPIPYDLGNDYAVYEKSDSGSTGWNLDTKSCAIQGGSGTGAADTGTGYLGGVKTITVASGKITVCTFNNLQQQPKLTLIKNVINDSGGQAVATDWTLTATGSGGFTKSLSSITTESGYNSSASTTAQTVSIGVQYSLSESATPAGYSSSGNTWTCGGGGTFVSPNQITLAAGDNVTCRIVNNDIAPTLTLIKNVKNDNGLTNIATDWKLSATGLAGLTSLNAIGTEQGYQSSASTGPMSVNANQQYTLSESTTPSGYTPGNWTCDGGSFVSPNKVTLGLNSNITCRIVNDDNAPTRTLLTTQSLRIYDSIQIQGYKDPGSGYGQVTFTLYPSSACSGTPTGSEIVALTVNGGNASAAMSTGIVVPGVGTYYWKVHYSGDSYNAASDTTCGGTGDEFTTITAIHNN